jgi:hypothetical protein
MSIPPPDILSLWLIDHLDIVPFIQADSPECADWQTEVARHRCESLRRLQHFYDDTLLNLAPEPPTFPHSGSADFLIHLHFFLQQEIFRWQKEKHEKAKLCCHGLIQILSELNGARFIVKIDHERLFQYWTDDPPAVYALKLRDAAVVADISQSDLTLMTEDQNRQVLSQILFSMHLQYDRNMNFLAPHPMQTRFDQLVFHQNFICNREMSELVQAGDFGRQVLKVMGAIVEKFKIKDSVDLSVFSIVFFRAIFDYAYDRRPELFRKGEESVIRRYYDQYRVRQTGADIKFVTNRDPEARMADVIAKDSFLAEAARELTAAALYNSPLDVLYCVHLALAQIRKGVAKIDQEAVQSFDTIFGLFLIVVLGSDVPDPEALFDLIEKFAPMNGLSGSLEYARSTVSAAALQCAAILETIQGG